MAKKLIYIIEDDSDIRDAFAEILMDLQDVDVQVAENGQVGLDFLTKTTRLPDLILLDVLMPIMDGFGFRQAQLQDERLKSIPIVVLSASHNITDLAEKMKARAYLKKPINIDELLEVVEPYTT